MMYGMPRTPRTLLLALVLLAVPSTALAADGEKISEISDSRVEESSGLAISQEHADLAYTINDGDDGVVFAVKISTGDVVGTTRVRAKLDDTESIRIDGRGRMWLSDLGDNDRERDDAALYRFPEPGPGEHSVNPKRFPVSYDGRPADIESLLVHPKTGRLFVASRDEKAPGRMYALPEKLVANGDNRAEDLGKETPVDTSDATFTRSGTKALLRTGEAVHVFDPETWTEIERLDVPPVKNGESIDVEPDGKSFIIGSEGDNSPLIRVAYDDGGTAEATPTPTPTPSEEPTADVAVEESDGVTVPVWALVTGGVVVVGLLAAAAVWAARRGKD